MTCPICLENNNNLNYLRCTHTICYQCLNNLPENLNGCPICRQGGSINYQTFYPSTQEYYPNVIPNWYNPNFHGIKGQIEDITNKERNWINTNWDTVDSLIENTQLIPNKNYLIIKDNNIYHGKYVSECRENQEEFIFTDCKILDREGKYYKSSPPTRKINLVRYNYLIYSTLTQHL